MSYTVVFKGLVRELRFNPLTKHDTVFGEVEIVCAGNVPLRVDQLEGEVERLRDALREISNAGGDISPDVLLAACVNVARAALSFPEHITITSEGRVGLTAEPRLPLSVEKE